MTAAKDVFAAQFRVLFGRPWPVWGAAILVATVLTASLLPALRASRVAPVEALREE